jgi:hypothetical protein
VVLGRRKELALKLEILVAQVLIDNGDAIKFQKEEITPKIKKQKWKINNSFCLLSLALPHSGRGFFLQ